MMLDKRYKLLKSKVILYVEDDLALQSNIRQVLNNFFDEILIASDGDEAIDIYLQNQNRIDLMITDINMPKTNGIELSKYIREYDKKLPIVIMSAYTNTDYLLDSIDLNIVSYITKPFTTKKVFLLLDKILNYLELSNHFLLKNNIKFNYEKGELLVEEKSIILTSKETIFLKLLIDNDIVSYLMMYEYMWDYDKQPTQNAIKSFIKKIKKKIPKDLFKNKQGVGYYLG
jgi:DNA-binding response OmpR family regulator